MDTPVSRDPVVKAFQIITWAVDSGLPSWGVREVAEALDLRPSTVHHSLTLLQRSGMVVQDEANAPYRLSLEFFRLARQGAALFPIEEQINPVMVELVRRTNGTAYFSLYDHQRSGLSTVVNYTPDFATLESNGEALGVSVSVHRWWRPLSTTSASIILLSLASTEERESMISTIAFDSADPRRSRDRFLHELDDAIERGLAVRHAYPMPHWVTIAAPTFDADGRLLGVVTLMVPEQDRAAIDQLASDVVGTTDQLTHRIDLPASTGGPARRRT